MNAGQRLSLYWIALARSCPRELDDLGAEIGVQSFHQRPAFGLSHGQALRRALAVDGALDREQRVDAAYDFDGDRGERDLLFARRLAARAARGIVL